MNKITKKPIKKRKVKVKVKQKAQIQKKGSVRKDTIPKVEGRPPASNAPTIKVKIRKK